METPQSREEAILQATINGEPYTGYPESRVEELLIELKAAIEEGGGGGGTGDGDMKKSVYDKDNNGIVDNAEKVNNHTVDKDVPSDAKFTDTVYDDTSISNRVSAIEEVVPSDATTSNKLATQSDIPSLTDYVQKSQTAGLIKNDGTIDSTSYATSASANKSVKTEYTLSYNSWETGTGDYLGYYIYEIETNPRLNGDYPVNVYLSSGQASDFMPTAEEVEAFNDSIVGGDMFSSDMGDYTKITLIAWQRPVDRSQTPKNLKVFIEGVKY